MISDQGEIYPFFPHGRFKKTEGLMDEGRISQRGKKYPLLERMLKKLQINVKEGVVGVTLDIFQLNFSFF